MAGILSEQEVLRELRDQRKDAILEELEVGETRKGVVSSLADFGAFVNIGSADGLIHVSELAGPWDTLDEHYSAGDLVRATITRIKDFGMFAKLANEPVEGLIHISEMSHEHVESVSQVVTVG